ncbi:MAG: histidinol-phosphatase [Clostridia bacterium]|nr:histidinol-phosphatase [Clostridia bacterium]
MTENYHTHTTRCGHAVGEDEQYVKVAVNAGFKVLGFSDHAPLGYPEGYGNDDTFDKDDYDGYVSSINFLKEQYKGKIKLYSGFEMGYYKEYFSKSFKFMKKIGIEYLILGQHCYRLNKNYYSSFLSTDSEESLDSYVNDVIEGIETGYFTYVAHPDVIHFTGDNDVYLKYMNKICLVSKKLNIPLEINFGGLRNNGYYPNDNFWKTAGETGCPVVFGCDAHHPQNIDDKISEQKALKMVEKYGLNYKEHIEIKNIQAI